MIIVDLSANAVDIACRLSSLVYFLDATEELQTCNGLVSSEFTRHSRKVHIMDHSYSPSLTMCHSQIISLIEVTNHLSCTS
jgi:hypothetical protein